MATLERRLLWTVIVLLCAGQVVGWFWRDVDSTVEGFSEGIDHSSTIAKLERRLARLEQSQAVNASGAGSTLERKTVVPDSEGLASRVAALESSVREAEARRAAENRSAAAQRTLVAKFNAAVARNDEATILQMLRKGLNINGRDHERQNPLGAAAVAGNLEMMRLFLSRDADMERKGPRGMTPLLSALDADQEDAALLLLSRGCDAEVPDKNGENALNWASFNGLDRVVDKLLTMGVDVDFRTHSGTTSLMTAARRGQIGIVRSLLARGAKVDLKNKAGMTALAHAEKAGHAAIAKLLREHGAR